MKVNLLISVVNDGVCSEFEVTLTKSAMVYPYDALNHKLLTSGFTLDKIPDHGKTLRLVTRV